MREASQCESRSSASSCPSGEIYGHRPTSLSARVGAYVTRLSVRSADGTTFWYVGFVLWTLLFSLLLAAAEWLLKSSVRYDRSLLRAARAGLRRGEFQLDYQPVFGIRRARCVGFDVLLRWSSETYGVRGPGHFMSFIQKSSVIRPLTRHILKQAGEEMRQAGVPDTFYLSITVPPAYILSRDFMEDLDSVGASALSSLFVNIDATRFGQFSKQLIPAMKHARGKGVRFALSGVKAELELPRGMSFEMLKIDRIVLALDNDERAARIRALAKMGHDLGAMVVVQGVESAIHHGIAQESQADFGQGFFYSRTLNVTRLTRFLKGCDETTPGPTTANTMSMLG
ncbi:EAL domain-containing protein [Paraburkholderia sp. WS6]|uniref:EAL domain-containing protein n=2 Tax=Burkholderiaceae TaxID=119060 RepID=A0AAP5ERI6_9BURK|nr:EAL domain-containing protein [Paraburkholderia sp. WS6]MCX4149968.1 EAL domain-containing protein [Paraburkholderia madseniana]MDN7152904.1 EAL domain-containing protein [Paraburkholderia sp. WS6]MDQ6411786.1 EAL domain-containing protein [Paraburkholderia madseniana]